MVGSLENTRVLGRGRLSVDKSDLTVGSDVVGSLHSVPLKDITLRVEGRLKVCRQGQTSKHEFTFLRVGLNLFPEICLLCGSISIMAQHLEIFLVEAKERWVLLFGEQLLDVQAFSGEEIPLPLLTVGVSNLGKKISRIDVISQEL